jgi:rhamnosyl/mannosyltransferase
MKPRNHAVIVTYHSDIVRQTKLLVLYAPFMRRVLNRAAAIICTSPNYIDSSPTLSAYRDKCHVIPYGIDLSQFDRNGTLAEEAARIRQHYGERLLLCVGRLIYYKGFEYAIEAMRHIKGQLLLIGDGPLRTPLERLARNCGVARRVHFLGEIHNSAIAPYYHASDLFVLPSIARSEAFGIVQLEAMACGKPVINTALDSGVPFVSRHNESGLTVEPKNAEALANTVNALLNDRALMHRLGETGRRRVEAEFSKEVMAERVLALYKNILCSQCPRAV